MRELNIVHLEDSENDSELLAALLQSTYELNLVRVDSEGAFIRAVSKPNLDVIISDFTLPSYSGATALTHAQTARPDVPFIFYSGTLGEEAAVEALRSGATDYILKSRPQKMVAAVERALRETDERRKRREAEAALERDRERFRALIENALDVISVLDTNGHFTYNSPSIERILGYTPEELKGIDAFSLVHPGDLKLARESFGLAIQETDRSITAELRIRHKDGSWRALELRGKGLRPGEAIEGVVINSRDVTEKRETEAQLLRAQRMECLGVLAGGMAHDLNNILSPVLIGAELLGTHVSDPDGASLLELIKASAERGSGLVRHILSFARGITGDSAALDVKLLVMEIVKLLRETFPKNIQFQVSLAADLKTVVCNPTELHQVIMNLCVNARDAMPEGGLLQVKASNAAPKSRGAVETSSERNDFVRITIADTGTGIPPEILPKIFDPFFTTKEEGKGTGLGLSTVLSIVKRNEGTIEVESPPGEGTSFHVYLRAAATGKKKSEERKMQAPTGRGERILVVDDESAILEITKAILENANYEVEVALNGVQALHMVRSAVEKWSLVISDASMPVMDGAAMIGELQRIAPKLPVICTTGEMGASTVDEVRRLGVKGVLPKPYSSRELLEAVAKGIR